MQRHEIDVAIFFGGSTWVTTHLAGVNWSTASNITATVLASMGIASYLWKWSAAWIARFKARAD
jgi:hypothetical protein